MAEQLTHREHRMSTHLLVALFIVLLVVIQVPIQKALAQRESMVGLWTGTTDLQVGYSENGVTVSASGSGRFSFTVSDTGRISGQGTFQGSITIDINAGGVVGGGSDSFSETDSYSGQVNFGTGVAVVDVTVTASNAPSSISITCTTEDGQTITVTQPIPSQMVTVSGRYQWQLTSGGVYNYQFPAPLSGYIRVTFTGPPSITRPSISTIEMSTTWRSFTTPSSTTIRSETTEETTTTPETTEKRLVVAIEQPYALVARGGWVSCDESIGFAARVIFSDGSTPNFIEYSWTTTGGSLSGSSAEEAWWYPPGPEPGEEPESGAVVAICTISLRATAEGYTGSDQKTYVVKYVQPPVSPLVVEEILESTPWYRKEIPIITTGWVDVSTTLGDLGILAVELGAVYAGTRYLVAAGRIVAADELFAEISGHVFFEDLHNILEFRDLASEGAFKFLGLKVKLNYEKFFQTLFESGSLLACAPTPKIDFSQDAINGLDVDNMELITIELDTGEIRELPVSSIDKAARTVVVELDHPCLFTLGIRRVPQTSTTTFTATTQSPQRAQLDLDLLTRVVVTIIGVLVIAVAAVAAARRIRSSGRPRLPTPPAASPQIAPGTRRFCGYCGAPIRPGALFCETCGKKLA